jgi:NTP pyrophosphatase (non-canonical NTP hydrolase)
MNLDEYQRAARSTAVYPTDFFIPQELQGIYYTVLGLCGEAGETANKVKKVFRGDFDIDEMRTKIAAELGGVLWYLAMAASELGYNLEEIAQLNLEELAERKIRGTIKGEGDER